MALVFPRDMTSAHEWERADLSLKWRQEMSQQADGTAIGKDLGSPIWKADFETMPMEKADAEALHADFLTLGGVARTFYAHTASRPNPVDEEGVDASGATIHSIGDDNDKIAISGLPNNYAIQPGDLISISTAAGGKELVVASTFHGSGSDDTTGFIYVSPHLRASVAVGDAVALSPPLIELRLEKDGLGDPTRKSGNLYTVSFKASQVIK